jgi:hypothetical protein
VIYVADSESSPAPDKCMGMRNAGFEKGIRIGDAPTGWVRHFLPDDRVDVMGYTARRAWRSMPTATSTARR